MKFKKLKELTFKIVVNSNNKGMNIAIPKKKLSKQLLKEITKNKLITMFVDDEEIL